MIDLEMTKLCADVMGLTLLPAYRRGTILYDEGQHDWNGLMCSKDDGQEYLFTHSGAYNPLHDDEQAMALVKKLGLDIHCRSDGNGWYVGLANGNPSIHADLNRAIVECVAMMQLAAIPNTAKEGK